MTENTGESGISRVINAVSKVIPHWHLTVKGPDGEVIREETDTNPKKLLRQGRTTPGGRHVEVTSEVPPIEPGDPTA